MTKTPFKLKSGNTTPFKMMGSSPLKQGDPLDLGLVDEAKDFDKAYKASKAATHAKAPAGFGGPGYSNPQPGLHIQDYDIKKQAVNPDVKAKSLAKPKAKDLMKRQLKAFSHHTPKILKKGAAWAAKRLNPIGIAYTAGEFFYDVGKRGVQRKKEGKSGFNPTKGQKTTTPKNKGFNF